MNMTVGGPGAALVGPTNSFLTVKNATANGNSKNNNKAYMQHIKSADEVIVEKRGGVVGSAMILGTKSDATTAADTSISVNNQIKFNELSRL